MSSTDFLSAFDSKKRKGWMDWLRYCLPSASVLQSDLRLVSQHPVEQLAGLSPGWSTPQPALFPAQFVLQSVSQRDSQAHDSGRQLFEPLLLPALVQRHRPRAIQPKEKEVQSNKTPPEYFNKKKSTSGIREQVLQKLYFRLAFSVASYFI